jgi:hypothetical protein
MKKQVLNCASFSRADHPFASPDDPGLPPVDSLFFQARARSCIGRHASQQRHECSA